MPFTPSDSIEVRYIRGKGRGVFARRAIAEGEVIERVPVLVLPMAIIDDNPDAGPLANYVFYWGKSQAALALGYGSLYNHSYRPNARYDDFGRQTKVYTALRDIAPGEEITVNYNGDPADTTDVGFEVQESSSGEPTHSRR